MSFRRLVSILARDRMQFLLLNGRSPAAIELPLRPIRFFRAKPRTIVCAGQASSPNALNSFPHLSIFISRKHILPITRKCLGGWAGPKDRF